MRVLIIALGLLVAGCAGGSSPGAAGSPAPTMPNAVRSAAPISARVILPARTMTAGSSMSGHVVIDNNTGRPIHASGCLTLFQVALQSSSYHPAIAWLDCLQNFTIGVGQSRFRVTVSASYLQCSQGRSSESSKPCLPGNHPPPLPPGIYHAALFQLRHLVPAPLPITIRVTRRLPLRPRNRMRPSREQLTAHPPRQLQGRSAWRARRA